MKILVDMNLSPRWVGFLSSAGYEATHWSHIGPPDAHDDVVLQWAADHDHVLLTSDLDFGSILAATKERRPSVVQLRSDALTLDATGELVLAALRRSQQELSHGALVSIEPARARLRILPLRD
jgi:predicted nuclease of predicted toxin-antitoxin system